MAPATATVAFPRPQSRGLIEAPGGGFSPFSRWPFHGLKADVLNRLDPMRASIERRDCGGDWTFPNTIGGGEWFYLFASSLGDHPAQSSIEAIHLICREVGFHAERLVKVARESVEHTHTREAHEKLIKNDVLPDASTIGGLAAVLDQIENIHQRAGSSDGTRDGNYTTALKTHLHLQNRLK